MRSSRAAGLGSRGVSHRVARGRLRLEYPGVFATGHAPLSTAGRLMAAVLACGDGSALSHRSSAYHRGLRRGLPKTIDVTNRTRAGRDIEGITVHSGATLQPEDVTIVEGIRCTTVARTILDVAEDATHREIERLLDQAEVLRILDMRAIDDVLARAHGRRGAATLRAVLSVTRPGTTITRSELEELMLAICRDIERPPDATNAWIPFPDGGGAEADFVWHEQRLVVEADGRDVHATRRAFEHDRRRDQRLTLLGWRVVRFTWRQLTEEPGYVAATLRALLD